MALFVITIWFAGFVFVVLRIAADVRRSRKILRRSRRVVAPDLDTIVREIAGPSVAKRVRLAIDDTISTPMTAGLRSHVILLPPDTSLLGESAQRAIIAHETAHVARYDCAMQLVARAMCAVHWFNPLAWYAARAMGAEAERACDDRALRTGATPMSYAELLCAFARRTLQPAAGVMLPMAEARTELEVRLRAILDVGAVRGSPSPLQRCAVATGIAAVVLVAASVHLAAAPNTDSMAVRPTWPEPRVSSAPLASASGAHTALTVVASVSEPSPHPSADERLITFPESPAPPDDERIPLTDALRNAARKAVATLTGPDSAMAHVLFEAVDHVPTHDADLVSDRATWALAQARGGNLFEPLLAALSSPDWREAAYAAWALAFSGDARALDPLVEVLHNPAWRARANAAAALAGLADIRSADAMRRMLADPAWQVRMEAVTYFGRLGGARWGDIIEPLLGDPHIGVRSEAADALSALRSLK